MTKEEFATRFRHRFLGLLAEAWSLRRLPVTDFGRLVEGQQIAMAALMEDIWQALQTEVKPVQNGQPARKA